MENVCISFVFMTDVLPFTMRSELPDERRAEHEKYEKSRDVAENVEDPSALKPDAKKEDIEMHFIGDIPQSKQIISDKIIYHGSVKERNAMISILRSCDVLICPSFSEGMPNVILEAMACGLAIIASNVGAVSLMVSEKNGWLMPHINTESILVLLKKAIHISDQNLDEMKKASLAFVNEHFLFENIIDKTILAISDRCRTVI